MTKLFNIHSQDFNFYNFCNWQLRYCYGNIVVMANKPWWTFLFLLGQEEMWNTWKISCFIFSHTGFLSLPISYVFLFLVVFVPLSIWHTTTFDQLNGWSIKRFPPVHRPWLVECSLPSLPHVFSASSDMCQMVSSHCWIHFHPPWLKALFQLNF